MGSITRFKFTITILALALTSLESKPTLTIESLNSSKYPRVEITLRENHPIALTNQNLVLTEEMEGHRTIPNDLVIERPPGSEPIQIVLSIQPTDSKAINQWSVDLATSLSQLLKPGDKLHVHIQEEKRFLYLKNQSYNTLRSGLVIPNQETYTKTLESLSYLLDNLSLVANKPPFLLVLLHSKSVPDKHLLVDISKKARRMGIPIHIFGYPSKEALNLSEYSDGKHYSLNDKDSTKRAFEDIHNYKNPPYKLSYTSRNEISLFEEKKVQIDLGVLNIQNLSAEYKINFQTRMENSVRDPYVFIPSAIFFLIILLTALVILPQINQKSKLQSRIMNKNKSVEDGWGNESGSLVSESLNDEARVYKQMYGINTEPGKITKNNFPSDYNIEEDDYDTKNPTYIDSLEGEKYNKALLIQKEGPSPGRQYNIYGHETYLGRLETNHLVIYDNQLSPVHARIKNIQNRYVLYDMLSRSGVFLNGKKLLRPKVLQDFDEILIGKTLLIFRGK